MGKRCVWAIAIGLVLLGARNSTAGVPYDLTKLKSVCVNVEDLSAEHQALGLSEEVIENYVYVWLKAKLPRLVIEQSTRAYTEACKPTAPVLWVTLNLDVGHFGRTGTYFYGDVSIILTRMARWHSGRVGPGGAYDSGFIATGKIGNVPQRVNKILDKLLTDFAAEYYKAGNP